MKKLICTVLAIIMLAAATVPAAADLFPLPIITITEPTEEEAEEQRRIMIAQAEQKIDEIGTVEYTKECEARINAAKIDVGCLSRENKKLLRNYDVYLSAIEAFNALRTAAQEAEREERLRENGGYRYPGPDESITYYTAEFERVLALTSDFHARYQRSSGVRDLNTITFVYEALDGGLCNIYVSGGASGDPEITYLRYDIPQFFEAALEKGFLRTQYGEYGERVDVPFVSIDSVADKSALRLAYSNLALAKIEDDAYCFRELRKLKSATIGVTKLDPAKAETLRASDFKIGFNLDLNEVYLLDAEGNELEMDYTWLLWTDPEWSGYADIYSFSFSYSEIRKAAEDGYIMTEIVGRNGTIDVGKVECVDMIATGRHIPRLDINNFPETDVYLISHDPMSLSDIGFAVEYIGDDKYDMYLVDRDGTPIPTMCEDGDQAYLIMLKYGENWVGANMDESADRIAEGLARGSLNTFLTIKDEYYTFYKGTEYEAVPVTLIEDEVHVRYPNVAKLGSFMLAAFEMGDANKDGGVNSRDVIAVMKYCVDKESAISHGYADMNCDGKINSRDVILLMKKIINGSIVTGDQSYYCRLLGHKLNASYATETLHNAYTTSPHCVQNTYFVISCGRDGCDHIEKILTNSVRISTCHG